MTLDRMMALAVTEHDDVLMDLATPATRPADPRAVKLPVGTIVVSADDHWTCAKDIFWEGFPDHLKDKAPRWHQDSENWGYWTLDGKPVLPLGRAAPLQDFESVPGCSKMEPRMRDLDAEGVDKEIVFPNTIQAFLGFPDLEVREWIFRIYNQYSARLQAGAPDRFYPVALANFWDMEKTRESILEIKKLGLKAVFLPQFPKGADGLEFDYCSPETDPLWAALEEAGLPVCFHVGEFAKGGPGGMAIGAMVGFQPFRKVLAELIFSGILDRHPTLQVIFTEADINWVPGALQCATMLYEAFRPFLDPQIEHHPRHYWQRNCYATFMHDPVGMRMLDIVGADRVMWSCDYVHIESNFGYSSLSKQLILDTVSEDDARAILGGTAMRVFDL